MTMVEKVARAISDEPIAGAETLRTCMAYIGVATDIPWDEVAWQGQMQVLARAAIRAMMEPTPEMVEAGAKTSREEQCDVTAVWPAMLTAALDDTTDASVAGRMG